MAESNIDEGGSVLLFFVFRAWNPSALQVVRTYRRYSGGGAYAAGYSRADFRVGASAGDRPAAGHVGVAACMVTVTVGQHCNCRTAARFGTGVNDMALTVAAQPVRRAASWRRARSTASLNEVTSFSPLCHFATVAERVADCAAKG